MGRRRRRRRRRRILQPVHLNHLCVPSLHFTGVQTQQPLSAALPCRHRQSAAVWYRGSLLITVNGALEVDAWRRNSIDESARQLEMFGRGTPSKAGWPCLATAQSFFAHHCTIAHLHTTPIDALALTA